MFWEQVSWEWCEANCVRVLSVMVVLTPKSQTNPPWVFRLMAPAYTAHTWRPRSAWA